ncbi:MAG: type II toxin-antitoxin system VapC family toxin [Chloroflexota bacterium]|nr:type II toxin-antitoxin system VapC family toxin [Chloroflexota bacterium]
MNGSQVVIDASFALRLFLPHPLRGNVREILTGLVVQGYQLVAPMLWAYETTSGVSRAVYMKAILPHEARRLLNHLEDMQVLLVSPDEDQNNRALEWTLKLNRGAAYDSYYLALAETFGCDLWTADRRLYNAIDTTWVRWIEERL